MGCSTIQILCVSLDHAAAAAEIVDDDVDVDDVDDDGRQRR
jgi:hypothetical protein